MEALLKAVICMKKPSTRYYNQLIFEIKWSIHVGRLQSAMSLDPNCAVNNNSC